MRIEKRQRGKDELKGKKGRLRINCFPSSGVQLVKCSVIVNDAEEAADCEKERGMGRVSLISRVKL